MRSLIIDQLNTLTDFHVHEAGNDQLFLVASCPQPVPARQAASRGLDDFPGVCVVADVCREELLFEIDAEVAFVNPSLELVE